MDYFRSNIPFTNSLEHLCFSQSLHCGLFYSVKTRVLSGKMWKTLQIKWCSYFSSIFGTNITLSKAAFHISVVTVLKSLHLIQRTAARSWGNCLCFTSELDLLSLYKSQYSVLVGIWFLYLWGYTQSKTFFPSSC